MRVLHQRPRGVLFKSVVRPVLRAAGAAGLPQARVLVLILFRLQHWRRLVLRAAGAAGLPQARVFMLLLFILQLEGRPVLRGPLGCRH